MDTMYLSALSSPIEVNARGSLHGFTLLNTFLFDCSQNYTTGTHAVVVEQGLTSPTKHIIGHIGDGFYGLKDPTNSAKALKEERS